MAEIDFYDLQLPVSDHHSGMIDWCMRNEGPESYYLLNHCTYVGHINDYPDVEFYFSTEYAAHQQAAAYYKVHGRAYPYNDEWVDSATAVVIDDEESQTMEFI